MSHKDDIETLYNNPIHPSARQWFNIKTPWRIMNFFTPQDIQYLNQIATSIKLSGNPTKKKELINLLMEQKGFKKLDAGTNRIVYKFLEDQSICIKIAFDRVAINDNLNEYKNQEFLKPFCAKCFEVTPCGTVGLFERVYPIKNREQFKQIADRVFDIIVNVFLGKYVLADFGTNFFKNWGIRMHSYPVILDYPYLYELDSAKLYCNNPDPKSPTGYCGGEIDYDDGFNFLVCQKCGKTFLASELSKDRKQSGLIIEREENYMNITIEKNGKTIVLGEEKATSTYKKLSRKEYKMKKAAKELSVTIERAEGREEVKIDPNPDGTPINVQESFHDKNCKALEVKITSRDGDKYETKKIDDPFGYSGINNVFGYGAEKIEETPVSNEAETIYKDKESDSFGNNTMAEVVKNINIINNKAKEEDDLATDEVEKELTEPEDDIDWTEDDEEEILEHYSEDSPDVEVYNPEEDPEVLDEF